MAYVDYDYYVNTYGGTTLTAENAHRALQDASDTIDTLTYCRIISRGIDGLSPHQKHIIETVTCKLAEWQTENADILDNPYSSYSVNGVTATWGAGAGIKQVGGIIIPRSIYAEIVKTGLCYPGVM